MTPEELINNILEIETGEYTNDPDDRGGPTKWGITVPALTEARGYVCTESDIALLTRTDAYNIYWNLYYIKPKFSDISYAPLRNYMTDCGVLHGRRRATRWLQGLVAGLAVDGSIGPLSIAAINKSNGRSLMFLMIGTRVRKIADFVQQVPSQLKYIEGWEIRATEPLFTDWRTSDV